MGELSAAAKKLLDEQVGEWKLLRDNVAALQQVQMRSVAMDGFELKIQFNRERKCFLCDQNRPPEQRGVPFGDRYKVLCNPFPIFREHFTIPTTEHRPQ